MDSALIVIDRDGTINTDCDYLGKKRSWRRELRLLPWAMEGLARLAQIKDAYIIVATNQSGVAHGYFGLSRVQQINDVLDKWIHERGGRIDDWIVCPYVSSDFARSNGIELEGNPFVLPNDHPKLQWRKPAVGMLRQAAFLREHQLEDYARIYSMGDKPEDQLLGINAGGVGILITNDGVDLDFEYEPLPVGNRIELPNLASAAEWIALDLGNK